MSRSALPQNYIRSTGTILEDFESGTIGTGAGYTYYLAGSGGRVAAFNTSQYLTGTQSMKMTVTGSMSITTNISAYLGRYKTFRFPGRAASFLDGSPTDPDERN